jgi:pimeloyl-ACP methyl ester carboxylesterase
MGNFQKIRRYDGDGRVNPSSQTLSCSKGAKMIAVGKPQRARCVSRDGTTISYRQVGSGPGLILVHGGMQSSQSFTKLAAALSDIFTVYVPDRRGRGLSGPHGDHYGIEKEVEDVAALIAETDAQNVFGLSSGALIALEAALILPSIRKIALYEPPVAIAGAPSSPMAWTPRYERELARGDLAAAMVTVIKGVGDRSLFESLPRFILVPLMRLAIRSSAKNAEAETTSLEVLVPTVHFDICLAAEIADTIEKFKAIRPEVLLMGGTKSVACLPIALDALSGILPNARRVSLSGLGHLAADDTGDPERVADELRAFFKGPAFSHSL